MPEFYQNLRQDTTTCNILNMQGCYERKKETTTNKLQRYKYFSIPGTSIPVSVQLESKRSHCIEIFQSSELNLSDKKEMYLGF